MPPMVPELHESSPVSGNDIRLVYTLTAEDWRDYHDALMPANLGYSPWSYYFNILGTNGLLFGFGYVCTIQLETAIPALVAIVFAARNIGETVPISRIRRKMIEQQAASIAPYEITLEISGGGLLETAHGITSFCPWSSVTRVETYKGVTIVHLASGQVATVPHHALGPLGLGPEEFATGLRLRGSLPADGPGRA